MTSNYSGLVMLDVNGYMLERKPAWESWRFSHFRWTFRCWTFIARFHHVWSEDWNTSSFRLIKRKTHLILFLFLFLIWLWLLQCPNWSAFSKHRHRYPKANVLVIVLVIIILIWIIKELCALICVLKHQQNPKQLTMEYCKGEQMFKDVGVNWTC